ncbi:MAG: aminodeoxychorismate/anthranilate synthase component II [Pleurocapsa sp. SU_196_0]|nr:aminodeoxychorismate/anthranilate synthase component II [Pleurocapsa sp. SU_196_0]
MRYEKILVVDNYDSFTYNLVQYIGELGAEPVVWRNDAFTLEDVTALRPDGIVISPGPCTPLEAGLSVAVIERFGQDTPLLGVCLGHQAIGQAFGARVVRAKNLMHGKTSSISHDGTGVFAGLTDGLTATRYHSLVIEDLPATLEVNAWVDEHGGRTVMGVRHREYPIHGVQFHPESALTESGHAMLENFLGVCA